MKHSSSFESEAGRRLKGESIKLIKDETDTVVIGKNPIGKPEEATKALPNDADVDDSHVRVEFGIHGRGKNKRESVNVIDLKSSSGTYIGSNLIRKGNEYRVFCNDSFRIGNSSFKVQRLGSLKPGVKLEMQQIKQDEAAKAARTTRNTSASRIQTGDSEATPIQAVPGLKRRGIRIDIVEGPHRGESFLLESGGVESVVLGSDPTASKKIDSIALVNDRDIRKNHVRLDLQATKRLVSVSVTDLKSDAETVVNRNVLTYGKSMQAFRKDRIKIGKSVLEINAL